MSRRPCAWFGVSNRGETLFQKGPDSEYLRVVNEDVGNFADDIFKQELQESCQIRN